MGHHAFARQVVWSRRTGCARRRRRTDDSPGQRRAQQWSGVGELHPSAGRCVPAPGPGHHRVAGRNRRQLCPATKSTHRCARRLRRASQRCVGSQCVDTNVAGAASNRCCPQRRVCHPVRDSVSDRAKTSRTSDHYQSQRRPHCRDRQSDWHLTSLTTLRSVDATVYRCNGLSMQRSTAPSSRCRRVRELRSQAPRCLPRHRSTHCRRVQRSHHPGSRRQPPRHSQPYCSSRLVGRCR